MSPEDLSGSARALIARASDPDRLYPLRSHDPYGFYTGRLPDGTQVIVFGEELGRIATLRFDPSGTYLGTEIRDVPPPPEPLRSDPDPERIAHDHFRATIDLESGPIAVRQFSEVRWLIGIRPLDDIHEEFVADPIGYAEFCEEGPGELLERLRNWVEDRQFVFDFHNNYWVDDEGEVTDS